MGCGMFKRGCGVFVLSFFFLGGIYHRVYGRNQPHQLIWRDSQYFCNQVFIYFKLAIKKPYFRTISRRKIIQFPPPKFNSKRSEKWWFLQAIRLPIWVNSGNFSGVNSPLNFGGVSLTKPGMIHAHHVSLPVNLMDSVCRKPVALLRDTYRLPEK